MRAYDVIRKKRDGKELTEGEIRFFVEGVTSGEIPDYQTAAFCMAVFLKGMTDRETAFLTFAIRDSGEKPDFSGIGKVRADKHSTGGVGDKTSLVVAPIVASCGVAVAKMSGRGLGHTGGTVDKLESIPGFRTDLGQKEFIAAVKKIGLAICGQSKELAPADKKFYAVRDVTATVDSIPLIVASIMGKKLAADDDVIVLDVKTGSGAFMKTQEEAERLARAMVDVGKQAGKKVTAFVTNMDEPLGYAIGNALEVREAVDALKGKGNEEFLSLCMTLAKKMLLLAGVDPEEGERAVKSGRALETFAAMVREQGGEENCVFRSEELPVAAKRKEVVAGKSGYVFRVDAEKYGVASLVLGAGRNRIEDELDYGAGILIRKKTGDRVQKGDVIAELFASDERKFAQAEKLVEEGTEIRAERPEKRAIVLNTIE